MLPAADATYNIGSAVKQWVDLFLSGNITVAGLVDGIDIAAHAANVSAHHSKTTSAEISLADLLEKSHASLDNINADVHADTKVRTVEVDETNKADGKVIVFRVASGKLEYEAQAGGGGGGPTKIGADYPERDITEGGETTIHNLHIIKSANVNVATLIVQAEGKAAATKTTTLKIYEGANLRITLSWTETSLTCKTGTYDASGWANGKHTLTAKVYVSGGTGRLEMIEYWVEE